MRSVLAAGNVRPDFNLTSHLSRLTLVNTAYALNKSNQTSLLNISQLKSPKMWGFLRQLWGKPRKDIYGLDHAVLNMQLPPQSMWMNVGYWEVSDTFARKTNSISLEANYL